MTTDQTYRLLDKARAYRPVILPGDRPGEWLVQSERDCGAFYRVNGSCDCAAGARNAPCKHRIAIAGVLRGIVDYATWEYTATGSRPIRSGRRSNASDPSNPPTGTRMTEGSSTPSPGS